MVPSMEFWALKRDGRLPLTNAPIKCRPTVCLIDSLSEHPVSVDPIVGSCHPAGRPDGVTRRPSRSDILRSLQRRCTLSLTNGAQDCDRCCFSSHWSLPPCTAECGSRQIGCHRH